MTFLRAFAFVLLPLVVSAAVTAAEPAHLVKDLKTEGLDPFDPNSGADFNSYLAVNGRVVFFGYLQPWSDCGLWVTDGTPDSAERLVDLCATAPDLLNSKLRMDATAGSVAWFEDVSGILWRTDGTSAGTYPLGVQVSRQFYDTPPVLGMDGKTLFFSGCAPTADRLSPKDCEPWRSDGTLQGTRRLRDVQPGLGSSNPSNFQPQGRRVLFIANGALWSTDGTSAGTRELVRIPGQFVDVERFLAHGTEIYIVAGGDFWVFDTRSGTSRRIRGFPEDFGSHLNLITGVTLLEAGGRVFLYQFDIASSPSMYSLWETDGTRAGTRLLSPPSVFGNLDGRIFSVGGGRLVISAGQREGDPERLWSIAPGTRQPVLLTGCRGRCPVSSFYPSAVLHDRLYFAGTDAGHGRELWTTDGTPQGTRQVADLCPGSCDGGPVQLRVALGRLIFTDPKGDLWASDGTAAGTARLAATGVSSSPFLPLDLAVLRGRIFFTGIDPASGRQPFASDLTPQGTDALDRIGGLLAASSRPLGLAAVGSRAVFTACGDHASGLWGSDGAAAGTVLLPGTETPCQPNPNFDIFRRVGNLAFFTLDGKLWRTDGTPAGTIPLVDAQPLGMAPLGDRLLFLVDLAPDTPPSAEGHDFAVWTSDGTPQGTRQVFTLRFTSAPSGFYFTSRDGLVFFLASAPGAGPGIWRTDGTAAGTFPLLEGLRQNDGLRPQAVVPGRKTYFFAWARSGYELWVNDGTPGGTTPVFPDAAIPPPLPPYELVAFRGALYFFVMPGPGQPFELWRSDGTAAGSRVLKAFDRGPGAPFYEESYPAGLTVVGDQLLFRADAGGHGPELWKTDGTPEGTVLVKDIAPGPANSRLGSLATAGGRLYFTADDGDHGDELWRSDGTAAGTFLVQDILPGPASSNPEDLTAADGFLYFTANDGEHGRELWALPLPR